ncbi:succinylglutamate desuccinylase/aspartoacylase family protein [uncultured Thiothrix sp.]|uniref:succinylglutamate desuccinylase/aspartoacylase family protein n=1 Tax=uncultured Thiothrix sp. TaxID=223185 RepID=UPI002628E9B5|nr:succinylglutamate desuccinylase/aspartoacylase family protein [uncultured Thiothrix sp.]
MTTQTPILVGDRTITAGEQRYVHLPLPHLYTHARISMPVYVMHGVQAGPRLFISAAIHGDEINGVEIIRRVLSTVDIKTFSGTLLAVPVVNVYGFLDKSRYLPDRRDLNRSFPGSEHGSMAAQLAHQFLHEVASLCTHGIDLHTAALGRNNFPQIRAHFKQDPELLSMAQAFNPPLILSTALREGSLREASFRRAIKVILYEAGEALRFGEEAIQIGVDGIFSVMRHLGMLPAIDTAVPKPEPLLSDSSAWVRAPQSGILHIKVGLGTQVMQGELLGHVADPFGAHLEKIYSPKNGLIIGVSTLPLVHEGEAIFHLAHLMQSDTIASAEPQHEIEPEPEPASL